MVVLGGGLFLMSEVPLYTSDEPLASGAASSYMVSKTFALKLTQAQARTWP